MAKNAFLTKPINVLRDTFVSQGNLGFVELDKLAKWLDEQRKAEVPEVVYWKKLFRDARFGLRQTIDRISPRGYGELVNRVGRIADHGSKAPYEKFLVDLSDPAKFFVSSLDRGKVVPYWITETSVAYVSTEVHDQAWVVEQDSEDDLPSFREIEACDIFDAALSRWNAWGAKQFSDPSPLCSWMAEALEGLCERAGTMFDEAVAVSQNGRHILMADHVVAYEVGLRHKIIARSLVPSAILPRKLVLGRVHQMKQGAPRGGTTEEKVFGTALKPRVLSKVVTEAAAHGCTQALLTIGYLRILFTPEATIPKAESASSPSPDLPDIEQGQPANSVQFDMNEVVMYGPLPSNNDDEAAIVDEIPHDSKP